MMGGSLVSSLIGMFGDHGEGEAQEYANKAIEELIKVKIPDPEQQKIALSRYYSTGQLDPKLESAIKADPSAFEQVVSNQKYTAAQDRALNQLQSLGEEGGLSLSDKANLQSQMIANANKDKANRDAITDDMARRGQLGSGMELQAQLAGAQSAGDRDAQARLQALGGAQDRAMQAIMGAGDLAGNLQSQDYQRKSDVAQARDRINMFNTQNAQSVQQRNVGSQNMAQQYNLDRSQDIANRNVDIGNQEQQYNKSLDQQRYQNEMQRSGAMSDVYSGAANQARQAAGQKRQQWGAVGSALGQMGAGIQKQANYDKLYAPSGGGSGQLGNMADNWDGFLKKARRQNEYA